MKKTRLTPSTTPSVARANRTRVATATTKGTKAVAATTTWVPIASASQTTLSRLSKPCEGELEEDLRRLQRLAEGEVPVASDGNHTTEQFYQLRRALKDTPEPRHPHDKKGKKKADEGNGDF
jgi:hypothetical protein